jgi:hypothetical protein
MLKGSKNYYIQQFDKRNNLINNELKKEKLYLPEELKVFSEKARKYVNNCQLRSF